MEIKNKKYKIITINIFQLNTFQNYEKRTVIFKKNSSIRIITYWKKSNENDEYA